MHFSLDHRTASVSVGELAAFQIGPREMGDGQQGLWRAQLGTHWHQQLRSQVGQEHATALFEVPLTGAVVHRGWRVSLSGRIDQLLPPGVAPSASSPAAALLREIKTVLRPIPGAEEELRAEYPEYFAQLAAYLALARLAPLHESIPATTPVHGELMFIEAGSGLAQVIRCTAADEQLFWVQLERLTEFLDLRLRARERLRGLQFERAFEHLRPGQETVQQELLETVSQRRVVFFEAPTGFGKTGALLETGLNLLKQGRFERVLYLTSKSTGQLQVVHQLEKMTEGARDSASPGTPTFPATTDLQQSGGTRGLAIWHVRNKREHCVNTAYHCVRDACRFLHDTQQRWAAHALNRFYLHEQQDRSMEALRQAGSAAGVCPYEITRTALAFNDVWIGDYNYVFAPSNRGLFFDQPGFDPAQTLLVIDEAHNLPSRVADAFSHILSATEAQLAAEELQRTRAFAPLVTAWSHWTHFLQHMPPSDSLNPGEEDDARHLLENIAKHIAGIGIDYAELGPRAAESLWQIPVLLNELATDLPRLWWSPRGGELHITCLDAARVIGPTLRSFGGSVLASATLSPLDAFSAACGLEEQKTALPLTTAEERPERLGKLNKRDTKKLFKQVSRGAELLLAEEKREADEPAFVRAATPWRDDAYDVAVDPRVLTTYQQRAHHFATTARTIERLSDAAHRERAASSRSELTACVAVFFPSYSYAEAILKRLDESGSPLRATLQPRQQDLAAQRAWVEEAVVLSDAIFLVLGSSFAEGIDILGSRVGYAMVVGPALPEVNAVQRARVSALSELSREAAFRRVYQIPGIQKVNQALGRLVRAPGQRAKVLLHCRRFIEVDYARLLAPEYQQGTHLADDTDLERWLAPAPAPSTKD